MNSIYRNWAGSRCCFSTNRILVWMETHQWTELSNTARLDILLSFYLMSQQIMAKGERDKPDMTCTKYIKTLSEETIAVSSLSHGNRWRKDEVGVRETRLEVKALRRALLLLVQDVLLGLFEVFVGDFHATLSQSHEACFCADGLEEKMTGDGFGFNTCFSEKRFCGRKAARTMLCFVS